MESRMRNCVFTLFNDEKLVVNYHKLCSMVNFVCWQYEICPTTLRVHVQGYIEFTHGKTKTRIYKLIGKCRIRARNGTPQEASEYCRKEESAIPDTYFEYGELSRQGHRTDIDEDVEIIRNGGDLNDISSTNMIRYDQSFIRFQLRSIPPRTEKPQLIFLQGSPIDVLNYCYEKYSSLFVYKDGDRGYGWNGYSGQNAVLMYGVNHWDTFADFTHFISKYPYTLRILYNVVQFNSPIILFYTGKLMCQFFIYDMPEDYPIRDNFNSKVNI